MGQENCISAVETDRSQAVQTQKTGAAAELGSIVAEELAAFCDVRSLRSFLTLRDLELDLIALLQALVALRGYSAVVDKHIRSVVAPYESITLGIIEPLHYTFQTFHLRASKHRHAQRNTCLQFLNPFSGDA
jgi:hypothetical protein